jgi:hypothetical protein
MRPKFAIDMNVGRLATWLRALGYDTVFQNPIDDGELVELARAEQRIVLTKDTGILLRRPITHGEVDALLIAGSDWKEWLRQVIIRYELKSDRVFTRCLECNTALEDADAERASSFVPARILKSESEFKYCSHCDQFLWMGGHWRRMMKVIEEAFKSE